MLIVVGVIFKKAGKVYYFDPNGLDLKTGDLCIVETVRGKELGEIVMEAIEVPEEDIVRPLRKVLRLAVERDKTKFAEHKEEEKKAFDICLAKIEEYKLPMRLVDVEHTFDKSKIIFYFTADGRVDFRELVRALAGIFRSRIELRQIGVRDEAKLLGGVGCCGRPLCCATFLKNFEPISVKMAKVQNLSLNPTKISGLCGRLMCCLEYEYETYQELRKDMPDIGARVKTEWGIGEVIDVYPLRRSLEVRFDDEKQLDIPVNQVEVLRR